MDSMGERLIWAREAGFRSSRSAALENGWKESTYRSHEKGGREFDLAAARKYGRVFKVDPVWLLHGIGTADSGATVPIVGYVGAGAAAHFVPAGELGEADAPEGATETTVAVEIRGDSLGSFFDRWLVFYDDVRRPLTPDLIGRLCVVGLADERVLIKKPQNSRTKGLFHLFSQTEDPILDVAIEWAAKVKSMVPR